MKLMEPSLKPYYIKRGKNFKNYNSRGFRFKPKGLGGLVLSTENSFGRKMIKKHYANGLKKWASRHKKYY